MDAQAPLVRLFRHAVPGKRGSGRYRRGDSGNGRGSL